MNLLGTLPSKLQLVNAILDSLASVVQGTQVLYIQKAGKVFHNINMYFQGPS